MAHKDDDFLFSIFQLNVAGEGEMAVSSAVAQYFCFPELGYAIAVRPGDVLLFNANVYHCISGPTAARLHQRVHVSSFYLKTAHVGGNDNTKELTEEEELWFRMKVN
jgi:hypothetical protein